MFTTEFEAKRAMHSAILLVASLSFAFECQAAVRFANSFQSHMVLQRAANTSIWGFSIAGTTVHVTFDSVVNGPVVTDSAGKWHLALNTADSPDTNYTVTATCSDGTSVSIEDILIGEVFLCSGQSNMDMPVSYAFNSSNEIYAAGFLTRVRLFGTATVKATTPQDDVVVSLNWTPPLGSVSCVFS